MCFTGGETSQVNTTQVVMMHDVTTQVNTTQLVTKYECPLDCDMLSMDDYIDLLLTTVSEFPGNFLHLCCFSFWTF